MTIRCLFPRLWHIYFIRCVQGLHDSLPLQPYVSASSPGGDSHRPTDCQIDRLPDRIYPIRCPFPRLWHIYFIRCTQGLHDSLPLQPYVSVSSIRCVQGLHDSLSLQPYVSTFSLGGASHRLPDCQITRLLDCIYPIQCPFPRLRHIYFIRCLQGLHDLLPLQPYVSASNPGSVHIDRQTATLLDCHIASIPYDVHSHVYGTSISYDAHKVYMTRCHCSHMCLHLLQGAIHIDRMPDCQIARSHLSHTMSIPTFVAHLFHTMHTRST